MHSGSLNIELPCELATILVCTEAALSLSLLLSW
jgi:hypothetical protein